MKPEVVCWLPSPFLEYKIHTGCHCVSPMMSVAGRIFWSKTFLMVVMMKENTWIGLTPSFTVPTPSTVVTDQPLQASTGTKHCI